MSANYVTDMSMEAKTSSRITEENKAIVDRWLRNF
jgi:hypothetical protein